MEKRVDVKVEDAERWVMGSEKSNIDANITQYSLMCNLS